MKALLLALAMASALAGCATHTLSDPDRLALYQAHAGEPVNHIRYVRAISWDTVGDQHLMLETRPNEAWLLTLSGPCVTFSNGSPFLKLDARNGLLSRFDRVQIADSRVDCQIREIQPLDLKAVQAKEKAMRAANQASGT